MKLFRNITRRIAKKYAKVDSPYYQWCASLKKGDIVYGNYFNHVVNKVELQWHPCESGFVVVGIRIFTDHYNCYITADQQLVQPALTKDQVMHNIVNAAHPTQWHIPIVQAIRAGKEDEYITLDGTATENVWKLEERA